MNTEKNIYFELLHVLKGWDIGKWYNSVSGGQVFIGWHYNALDLVNYMLDVHA